MIRRFTPNQSQPNKYFPRTQPPADTTTGTGMDVKTTPSPLGELMSLLVPGLVVALLGLVIYLSTKKG